MLVLVLHGPGGGPPDLLPLGGKDRLVWVTHRFAMAGLALLALAMLLSIWIVIAYLFTYLAAHVISGYWPRWWSCCGSLCRCISGRR